MLQRLLLVGLFASFAMMAQIDSYTRLLFLFTLLSLSPGTAAAQGKIAVVPDSIDLGAVYAGDLCETQITIANVGTATLRLYSVYPSCGCTTLSPIPALLAPGMTDTLGIRFDTYGHHGRVDKPIQIASDDSAHPFLMIPLVADVREEVAPAEGSEFRWLGDLQLGKVARDSIRLENLIPDTVSVRDFTITREGITLASPALIIPPQGAVWIPISVEPLEGNHPVRFDIPISGPHQKRVPLTISYLSRRN